MEPTAPAREDFFKGTKAADRLKAYLRDVPVLHARLVKVIEEQEANLIAARKSLEQFEDLTARIKATVATLEETERDGS